MSKKRLIVTSTISIILISILMFSSTYSIFTSSEIDEEANVYKTGNLDITYTLSEDNVTLTDIKPINNSQSCMVTPYQITVTNNGNVPYQFNLILDDTTAGDKINYQYIGTQVGKYEVKSLSDCTDRILKEGIIVPANSSVTVDVRIFLLDTIQNTEIGKSFYAKLSIDGIAVYADENIDNSNLIADTCANKPNLDNGNLIPVYYDDTSELWRKADSTNLNNSWYDYDNKKWANAIIKDENTIVDLSSNLNNGTLKYGATWNKQTSTVTTDGVDDYVDLGLANYNFGSDVSFVTRVKFNKFISSRTMEFLGNWESGGGGLLVHSEADNTLEFNLHIDGSYRQYYSNFEVSLNTWYTIVGTYNGSNLVLYVNGVQAKMKDSSTSTVSGSVTVSPANFTIGGNPDPWYQDFVVYNCANATTSDVLIFDRALTADEVASDYSGVPSPTNKTDLLLYYDFSDGEDIPVDTALGDTTDDGTLAFYTWIPRYKYRVWNITRQGGDETTYAYPAYTYGIDIEWENSTRNTGNVECNYNINSVESASNLSDTCVYNKTDTITTESGNTNYTDAWYTHPAFTFGNKELEGFWIGKFETTGTAESPTVLPNLSSLREQIVSEQFTTSKIFQKYLSNNIDAHMLTNLERGAVAYLSHSIYGLCDGQTSCRDIYINNSEGFYTGRSAGVLASDSTYSTDGTYDYKGYLVGNSTKDISKVASTTGNITGVYDMSGGSNEYVMGNMVDDSGSFYPSYAGSSWNGSSTLNIKYYNSYSYGENDIDQIAFNRSRLGDATAEVIGSGDESYVDAWQPGSGITGALSEFVNYDSPWFLRGGDYSSAAAGPFYFYYHDGNAISIYSFRSSLS